MVAPIVGPTAVTLSNTPEKYDFVVRWRQARPIDRVLPYERKYVTGVKYHAVWGKDSRQLAVYDSAQRATCLNQAYDRFKSKLGDQAQLGNALLEYRQSASMVTRRLYDVANLCIAIKRKDFELARKVINEAAVPKGANVKKSFADNFLEYKFGWSAAMSDIYNALDVLSNQQLGSHISASCQVPYLSVSKIKGPYSELSEKTEGVVRVKMGALVSYTNKNLDMLNRLGLINPLSVALEAVPLSFVVEWFANVNQMCSLMTDFIGLSLSQAYTTYSWRVQMKHTTSNWFDPNNPTSSGSVINGVYVKRNVGLDKPTFKVRPVNIGIGKAVTAAALVVQRLNESGYKELGYKSPPKRYYNWGFNPRP